MAVHKMNLLSKFTANKSYTQQLIDSCIRVISIILAVTFIILMVMSLDWPLIWDVPIFHYIGWLMSIGKVPYKDIFDMNFPGTFLLHLFVIKVFGSGDLGWRLFDLLWLNMINVCVFYYLKPFGRLSAFVAAVTFSVFYLSSGPLHSGERDYFIILFMLMSIQCLASSFEKKCSLFKIALAGLILGGAIMIKPYVGAFYSMLLASIGIYAYRKGYAWITHVFVFVISGLFIPLAMCLWLGAQGGLRPFWDMMVNYLPIYSDLSRQPWQNILLSYDLLYIPLVFEGFIVLVISILFFIKQKTWNIRRGFLCLGVIYGLLHYLLQGRDWYYYLFPFLAFLIFLAASWLHDKDMQRHPVVHTIMLLMLLHLSIGYGIAGIKNIIYPLDFRNFTGYFLANDLKNKIKPGDEIQIISHWGPSPHAMLLLQQPMVTRFVLTFHLFHNIQHPYIQKLRAEFLKTLQARRPKIIAVYKTGWNENSSESIKKFPALADWLGKNYKMTIDKNYYQIFERLSSS